MKVEMATVYFSISIFQFSFLKTIFIYWAFRLNRNMWLPRKLWPSRQSGLRAVHWRLLWPNLRAVCFAVRSRCLWRWPRRDRRVQLEGRISVAMEDLLVLCLRSYCSFSCVAHNACWNLAPIQGELCDQCDPSEILLFEFDFFLKKIDLIWFVVCLYKCVFDSQWYFKDRFGQECDLCQCVSGTCSEGRTGDGS